MDAHETDPRFQTPKELAGPHHEEMMRSKEAALDYLSAPDYRVRLAAILICETTWKCGATSGLVEACRSVADSDAKDPLRICAIRSLAIALSASESPDASQFLANLVLDSTNSMELQRNAYWALREVQCRRVGQAQRRPTTSPVVRRRMCVGWWAGAALHTRRSLFS